MKAKTPTRPPAARTARRVGPKPAKPVLAVQPQPSFYSSHTQLWYALGFLALGLVLYWRSLHGPFLFDDTDLLEARSAVRLKDWRIMLSSPRPLLMATFALNHLLWGFDPFYFHFVNVLLHVLNTWILWRIVWNIFRSPGVRDWCDPAARSLITAFTPLLFLATPIQTESVAYISSRSELLAATFYLSAMWLFLSDWREKQPVTTSIFIAVLYGCAFSSKQHALTLPAALLLLDYFFLAGQDWRQLKKNWRVYAALGVEMFIGGTVVVRAVLHVPSAGFHLRGITWKTYLLTQFRMYFLYLRLLFVPFGLNADYDIRPSHTLVEHAAGLALAGITALLGVAIWLRRRFAAAAFGILFFFVALFPTSSFYPLADYAAERRLYLPSIGFLVALLTVVTGLVFNRARRAGGASPATSTAAPSKKGLAACFVTMLVILSSGTIYRNRVWADPLLLWQDTAAKSPGKWRVFTWLGAEYSSRRMYPEAMQAYQRALALKPRRRLERAEVLSSLGVTLANQKRYQLAIHYYQRAAHLAPGDSTVWTNLAVAELHLDRPIGWDHFKTAIEANALAWEPHLARGNAYYERGRYDEAIQDYERVLQLMPDHGPAQKNLAAARMMKARQSVSTAPH